MQQIKDVILMDSKDLVSVAGGDVAGDAKPIVLKPYGKDVQPLIRFIREVGRIVSVYVTILEVIQHYCVILRTVRMKMVTVIKVTMFV